MASITPPEVKLFSRSEALQDAICVTALMKFANSPEDERKKAINIISECRKLALYHDDL
jgi:hypothetical protein